jgi:hypothetical protein
VSSLTGGGSRSLDATVTVAGVPQPNVILTVAPGCPSAADRGPLTARKLGTCPAGSTSAKTRKPSCATRPPTSFFNGWRRRRPTGTDRRSCLLPRCHIGSSPTAEPLIAVEHAPAALGDRGQATADESVRHQSASSCSTTPSSSKARLCAKRLRSISRSRGWLSRRTLNGPCPPKTEENSPPAVFALPPLTEEYEPSAGGTDSRSLAYAWPVIRARSETELSAWSRTWSEPRRRETSGSPPGSGSPSCPGP